MMRKVGETWTELTLGEEEGSLVEDWLALAYLFIMPLIGHRSRLLRKGKTTGSRSLVRYNTL